VGRLSPPPAELSADPVSEEALFDVAPTPRPEGGALSGRTGASSPLAVRMRPRNLSELVGQDHLLAEGSPLRQLVESDRPSAVILWGPPGTGKTTIAAVVSASTSQRFVEISAVAAGVKEVREAIDGARRLVATGGPETVLFVDEVHRFSKAQQDALLPGVENRWVTLIAATTENPFFSVISPLLSRSLLLTLEPLSDDAVRRVIEHALVDDRGLGGSVELTSEATDLLVRLAGGDARRALTYLEFAAAAASDAGHSRVDVDLLQSVADRAAVRYDRQGDQHYDVISAFIKSVRGSDVDAALHYLARMVTAGEDPRFIARRLVILASEDIGLADPSALATAVAAAQAVQLIGMPEARLNLAQAVIALALAPKSNAVITAIDEALADVASGRIGAVPAHLRDGHYPGSRALGHGERYQYAHDDPRGVAPQRHSPEEVRDRVYYRPSSHGSESDYAARLERIRAVLNGEERHLPAR
jgi:putative ATPase